VETARVQKRAVFRSTVTASGEVVAERYAEVGSSVMGKLVSLPVKEGDRVRRGQVVARIDAVPAERETPRRPWCAPSRPTRRRRAPAPRRREGAARGRELRTRPAPRRLRRAQAAEAAAACRRGARRAAQARAQLARATDLVARPRSSPPSTAS
jgi:HlyD family secretion protein